MTAVLGEEEEQMSEVSFDRVRDIVFQIRRRCPWDREQTHASLRSSLLEECYEVLEAIEDNDMEKLCQELGDLLLQVLLHSQIAADSGKFSIDDVMKSLHDKIVRRHPHVFGSSKAEDPDRVLTQWHKLKQAETGKSILETVPRGLPALAYSQEIQERAARLGFDWENIEGIIEKLEEEIRELTGASSTVARDEEFGDLLFTLVNIGRRLGIDVEAALRKTNNKFCRRFSYMEDLCRKRGVDFASLSLEEKERLWEEAKKAIS